MHYSLWRRSGRIALFYGVHRAIYDDISYDNMCFLAAAENAGGRSEFLLYNG